MVAPVNSRGKPNRKLKMKILMALFFTLVSALVWALPAPCADVAVKPVIVTDLHGRTVTVPGRIQRVVTISDGMIEGIMTCLGEAHKIVGLGSACLPKIWSYEIPSRSGKSHSYKEGMNPVFYLNPGFADLPLITQYGSGINYEAIAALKPDLIIVRTGSCSLCGSADVLDKSIQLLASLGPPLVVLHGPNTFSRPDIATIDGEIRLLGQVFQKENTAEALADFLQKSVKMVHDRTCDIAPADRKRALLLGLSPTARGKGGAGHVKGEGTIQTYFLNQFVHADNACRKKGAWNILNTEQLISLDPDVIVLITAWGYHPPAELYEAPYYRDLGLMRAVRQKAVTALPWTPCNCEKRLEYPIDVMVMAKAAYPERFKDIRLCSWLIRFYMQVYKVDRPTAEKLISCQWMDWACEKE